MLYVFIIVFYFLLKKEDAASTFEQKIDPKIVEFLRSDGFKVSDIKHTGECLVAEGDQVLKLSVLEDIIKESNMKNDRNEQEVNIRQKASTPNLLVNLKNVVNIPVFISPGLSSVIGNINTALSNWTNITQSRISFTVVNTQTSTGINIFEETNTALPLDLQNINPTAGLSNFSSNGKPGRFISISLVAISPISTARRIHVFMHEIGHTLGFKHTNGVGQQIAGTPLTDVNSIMNQAVPTNSNATWTTADLNAIGFLYPDTYITPNILSNSIYNIGIPNSRNISFNIASFVGENMPYTQTLSRFQPWQLSSPVQTETVYGGPSTQNMNVPLGTWVFKVKRNNYASDLSLDGGMTLPITVQ